MAEHLLICIAQHGHASVVPGLALSASQLLPNPADSASVTDASTLINIVACVLKLEQDQVKASQRCAQTCLQCAS